MKILTGPKGESLLDLLWHPVRASILSVSNGVVNVWSHKQKELWSAYAPNFKELDENEEYEEKESEFDIEDEDKTADEGEEIDMGEELAINITKASTIPAFCSSEEESEGPLDWLPFAPEVDDPEEPGWGQLEPTLNELPKCKKKRNVADEIVDPATIHTSPSPPEKKKLKVIDIDLPEVTAPTASSSVQDVATSNNSNSKGSKKLSKDSGKTKK